MSGPNHDPNPPTDAEMRHAPFPADAAKRERHELLFQRAQSYENQHREWDVPFDQRSVLSRACRAARHISEFDGPGRDWIVEAILELVDRCVPMYVGATVTSDAEGDRNA